jgi:quinolinate synthase
MVVPNQKKLDAFEAPLVEKIRARREELGKSVVILAHHYQRRNIVELGDYRGDSYGLCKAARSQEDATSIVFCGVRFMVESARVLARPEQKVFHPNWRAGCPMADMADIDRVQRAWNELSEIVDTSRVIPVTYMNSDVELKAFCGRNRGIVCTSTNAPAVYDWSFARGDRLFFFPDEHLGRNTANLKGFDRKEIALWDWRVDDPLGGLTADEIRRAKVILWKGYCHVHEHFNVDMVMKVRRDYPDASVVVHPECTEDVLAVSDANGSTGFIVRYCEEAPPGSVIAIGTEVNLVARLAYEHPDKTIFPLSRSLCPNMWRVDLPHLLNVLENFEPEDEVHVPDAIAADARIALENMLEAR